MNYFKLVTVDRYWLEAEIAKGNIFYKHYSFSSPEWVPCGEYFDGSYKYDRICEHEVFSMMKRNKNVYWRN